MITVTVCNNLVHAQMVKSVLNDSGIEVLIPDENTAQTAPYITFGGGIRVQVAEESADIAQLDAAAPGSDVIPPAFT